MQVCRLCFLDYNSQHATGSESACWILGLVVIYKKPTNLHVCESAKRWRKGQIHVCLKRSPEESVRSTSEDLSLQWQGEGDSIRFPFQKSSTRHNAQDIAFSQPIVIWWALPSRPTAKVNRNPKSKGSCVDAVARPSKAARPECRCCRFLLYRYFWRKLALKSHNSLQSLIRQPC